MNMKSVFGIKTPYPQAVALVNDELFKKISLYMLMRAR